MKFYSVFWLCMFFMTSAVVAQEGFIVRYSGDAALLKESLDNEGSIYIADYIPFTDIYLLKAKGNDRSVTKAAIERTGIAFSYITESHLIEKRSKVPDDPYYKDQWQYDIIHAAEAWSYGTGGVTCDGDTIVMAVLDAGFDLEHDDFKANIWLNRGEIPGDGIDNDNNGYTDDYLGLNTGNDNDVHEMDSHGLQVAGIMGAVGNNNKGVAGVNWNSKIMLVSYIPSDFYVIKGLHYILTQRRKYNETKGKEGAFVVSVNNSFGISYAFPEDGHELWCSMYDSLGLAGIVPVAATTNSNRNVDKYGDMPTTCPSEYLIAVTNTDKNDKKVSSAGYGAKSIDIGAPGEGVFTLGLNNSYSSFTGTSAAAPHVAGAVGFLYSTACCDLAVQAKTAPSATALKVREYILTGAAPNASLKDITTRQGRLDLYGAFVALASECGNTTGEDKVDDIRLINLGEKIMVNYTGSLYNTYKYRVYSMLGVQLLQGEFEYTAFGPKEFELDTKGLVPGAYLLSITGGKSPVGRIFVKLK